jgi:hypothetical protein
MQSLGRCARRTVVYVYVCLAGEMPTSERARLKRSCNPLLRICSAWLPCKPGDRLISTNRPAKWPGAKCKKPGGVCRDQGRHLAHFWTHRGFEGLQPQGCSGARDESQLAALMQLKRKTGVSTCSNEPVA